MSRINDTDHQGERRHVDGECFKCRGPLREGMTHGTCGDCAAGQEQPAGLTAVVGNRHRVTMGELMRGLVDVGAQVERTPDGGSKIEFDNGDIWRAVDSIVQRRHQPQPIGYRRPVCDGRARRQPRSRARRSRSGSRSTRRSSAKSGDSGSDGPGDAGPHLTLARSRAIYNYAVLSRSERGEAA